MTTRRIWLAVAWLAIAAGTGWASGAESPVGTAAEIKLEELCAKVKPAFVFIGGGSGVVIEPGGVMLTNHHVIEKGTDFDVRLGDGRHFKAKLLGRDIIGDLAALQLTRKNEEPLPFLDLADSDALQVGDAALAVGNPFGLGLIDQHPTYTVGIVSAVRQLQGRYTECILTDAEVNPGNSGGPLVNMAGQVVGINGQISTRWGLRSNTGLGFAISAKQIRMWLPLLKGANGGAVAHGRPMGLDFNRVAADLPDSLLVKAVGKGTAAETAGFQVNDRLLKWDGQAVPNGIRLISLAGMYPEGYDVPVEVRRGDADVKLSIRLVNPDRPAKPAETKPAEAKPAEPKPGEPKPPEPKAAESKPEAAKP